MLNESNLPNTFSISHLHYPNLLSIIHQQFKVNGFTAWTYSGIDWSISSDHVLRLFTKFDYRHLHVLPHTSTYYYHDLYEL